MKKYWFLLIFVLLAATVQAKDKRKVILFYSTHCHACLELKAKFLPEIKEKYKDKIDFEELDIDIPDNLALFISVSARSSQEDPATPTVLVADKLLKGRMLIERDLEPLLLEVMGKPYTPVEFLRRDLVAFFQNISAATVIGSGLVDGVNPCAFAVIVFFVSFLAVYGYRRREIALVGSAYCFAVFLTYLLLGFGLFKFLYRMSGFYLLIKIFYYLVAFFCFLLAILSLYDYIKYKKTGEAGEMILQLPGFLKKKINLTIGARLRKPDQERSALGLMGIAFTIGLLVSLMEAVCTGQVYVPTIVFILKTTNLRAKAFLYLLLYNLMFVLPLIIVFLLSLFGVSSQKFNQFLKRNLGPIKLMMFALFFILALMLLVIS